MFWKKEYKVEDIYSISDFDEKVELALDHYGVYGLDIHNSLSEEWAGYGYTIAMSNDLNSIYAGSMASMISGFASGLPVSFGTDEYLKEDKIEFEIIDQYNKLNEEDIPEEKKLTLLIEEIIKIYNNKDIKKYEKVVFRTTTFLTWSENERFERIKGSNNHEKMQNLIDVYYKTAHDKLANKGIEK